MPSGLETSARRSRSNSSPATAAASAALLPSGESSEARISTASRTVSGRGTSPPFASSSPFRPLVSELVSWSARASSSTKKETPWVRSCIALASEGAGALSRICCSTSADSLGSSGPSAISSRRPPRRSSCRTRRSAWSRGRPSER
jgi:hypothetical protein